MAYSEELIRQVGTLFKQGVDPADIEKQTGVASRTQRTWRRKYDWVVETDIIKQIEYRIADLMLLEAPTKEQNKQLSILMEKLGQLNGQKKRTEERRVGMVEGPPLLPVNYRSKTGMK